MVDYTISLTDLEDKALTCKASELNKTKQKTLDDFIKEIVIAPLVRKMLEEEKNLIKDKWDLLTQIQKDQIIQIITSVNVIKIG